MKKCLASMFALAVLSLVSQARAAEGLPSSSALSAMGLSGMQIMSDAEGMSVRGMGYSGNPHSVKPSSLAFGASYAKVGDHGASAGSVNGYLATGPHAAGGSNLSFAGKVNVKAHVYGPIDSLHVGAKVHATVVFAGGASSAYSH
jgi:hypothetical protein